MRPTPLRRLTIQVYDIEHYIILLSLEIESTAQGLCTDIMSNDDILNVSWSEFSIIIKHSL